MKEIFDDYLRTSLGEEKQATIKFKQFEHNYRSYFPKNKALRVLDIGIGRGEMLTCMKNWGYQNYLGIDISPSTVKFCSSIGLNCKLVSDSEEFLLQNKQEFDVITLLDVLEHFKKENVVSFLRALKESLKPDGVLIIQVPNLQAPDGHLHRYNDITHEVGYIEHSLQQVLMASGFENISFMGFEELIFKTPIQIIKKSLRATHWAFVRFLRFINANLNPKILHPVFFAVIKI